jgi:hypothetical protein
MLLAIPFAVSCQQTREAPAAPGPQTVTLGVEGMT